MKITLSLLLGLLVLACSSDDLYAQHRKLTVILLRHAEKDLSEGEDNPNPNLSAEGKARAERLIKVAGKYRPDAIYSTSYIRTRATVTPLARRRRHMILMYDSRNLNEMRDLILSGKLKRILVVGHNNTTPALVNMLIGEEKYKTLPESEYSKIWVVKIRKNKNKPTEARERIIEY
jgi:phosphohistidine phosphatase SixA